MDVVDPGSLGAFALLFSLVALAANLYDMENLVARLGWWVGPQASGIPNVVIPGLVLLAGGGVFARLDRRPPDSSRSVADGG